MLEQHAPKNHACKKCSHTFAFASQLKVHSYSHLSLGKFVCTTCKVKYKTVQGLRVHKESHTPGFFLLCWVFIQSYKNRHTARVWEMSSWSPQVHMWALWWSVQVQAADQEVPCKAWVNMHKTWQCTCQLQWRKAHIWYSIACDECYYFIPFDLFVRFFILVSKKNTCSYLSVTANFCSGLMLLWNCESSLNNIGPTKLKIWSNCWGDILKLR